MHPVLQEIHIADRIVVINLPERIDRRIQIAKNLKDEGINYTFSDGVRVSTKEIRPEECRMVNWADKTGIDRDAYMRGLVGCKRAHLKCLRDAQAQNASSLLILEDDVEFRKGWRAPLREAMRELPPGWLQLYFSAYSFRDPIDVGKHLQRLTGAWQTTAILYSEAGIEAAAQCLLSAECEIDHWLAIHLHSQGHSYIVHPEITYQRAGFSDCRDQMRGELH